MTKLSDIAATLSVLSQQFASLSLEGAAAVKAPNSTGNAAGVPLEPARRAEIKALLRFNATAQRPISMTEIARSQQVSRPTLYAIKKEMEAEEKAKAKGSKGTAGK